MKFHIQCINESLIPFIDRNDVLSLNAACINDEDSIRIQSLLDSFYINRDNNWHLAFCDRIVDVEQTATKLPVKDKYNITTSYGFVLKLPKVLFEVFSEHDAGRHSIKLALACLIDVRVFYRADTALKMEVYEICRFCFFTHIRPELLRMIILTVTEEYSLLNWFGKDHSRKDLIAIYRPDMLLFWKKIPIQDNYLPLLDVKPYSLGKFQNQTTGRDLIRTGQNNYSSF
ncbi:hypothetical protein CAEBREN_11350 [Caenorhabditis brenneri]|uniref:Uncharacterized protein n=1 Tax=Caenorhabditis brenneri TaxID=135651 RepID=G0NJU8_CAEBE|nr:hypothetical protein CAEBREN_11350 [Caenorhabditis brenneri]